MEETASPPCRTSANAQRRQWLGLLWLLAPLLVLFYPSFAPDNILFSNDGPLGASAAAAMATPGIFTGIWHDLNWVGAWVGTAPPNLTNIVLWLLGPLFFAKFYAPISVAFAGVGVWALGRQLRFHPAVCGLTALAAGLNTDFFSYACWGLGPVPIAIGWVFFALAALVSRSINRSWVRFALAGFAVGMAVSEGFDVGAILSLYVAAFVLFQALWPQGLQFANFLRGLSRIAAVALCAAWIAACSISMLLSTQVENVVGMEQDKATRRQRWEDATQWSLPKLETLRIVIPGLFGYRMDTPGGGNYWGRVGERPGVLARHSGSGVYAGVLVVVVALWAFAQSLRGSRSAFDKDQRRMVWFWAAASAVSLLLAWGKYAPFYQLVYAVPYFSTIRNPIKFMHPFHLGLVILFGMGLQGMFGVYIHGGRRVGSTLANWRVFRWRDLSPFDRNWMKGVFLTTGAALVGWLQYAAWRPQLEHYLRTLGFSAELSTLIARFSITEVGWFVAFLAAVTGLFVAMNAGWFATHRAYLGWIACGLLLVLDLIRANSPWVVYWDYREKYGSNQIIDFLRERPHERRVVLPPFNLGEAWSVFCAVYNQEWLQHLFQYYNIQSLDVIQEPRQKVENATYRRTFATNGVLGLLRLWELTNTRLLFGLAGDFTEALNREMDPAQKRFKLLLPFKLSQETPGGPITALTNSYGPFALIEFTGALPRAKLYTRWQTKANDAETLGLLVSPSFQPHEEVLVNSETALTAPPQTNAPPGEVTFVSYAPKRIVMKTKSHTDAILLLNDKYDSHWRVLVDDQPRPLLRCNFLMRGVQVPPGEHSVCFLFSTSLVPTVVSLSATIAMIVLLLGRWTSVAQTMAGDRERPA